MKKSGQFKSLFSLKLPKNKCSFFSFIREKYDGFTNEVDTLKLHNYTPIDLRSELVVSSSLKSFKLKNSQLVIIIVFLNALGAS